MRSASDSRTTVVCDRTPASLDKAERRGGRHDGANMGAVDAAHDDCLRDYVGRKREAPCLCSRRQSPTVLQQLELDTCSLQRAEEHVRGGGNCEFPVGTRRDRRRLPWEEHAFAAVLPEDAIV